LREQDDYDSDVLVGRMSKGFIRSVLQLDPRLLRDLLACAAAADDTTRQQARHILDAMAAVAT
jgi:hypothetical protein